MTSVDSRDYILSGIYTPVLEPRRCAKHNVACQHSQQTRYVDPMLAQRLRRLPIIKAALVQRLMFAGLRSIAASLVVLTAGGDYKLTPTRCLLNVGPASPCWPVSIQP